MDTPADMQRIRAAIEAVDREILAQLRQRMDLAAEIAAAKLDSAAPFRDQQREQQVLDRVRRLAAEGGLDPHSVEKLYRDASMYLHMDGTVDVTNFKITKNLFPDTAGKYAGND